MDRRVTTIYKEIEISVVDNLYVETKGLKSYLTKEIRIAIGNNQPESYVDVIKYITDYIIDNKPIISENQNIGYYSWLLQFRLDEDKCYDLYEASIDGSSFNKGCDTAISVVRQQREICWQQNLIPLFPNFNQSVVISDGVYEGKDIEGIRYESSQDESGWYLITDDWNDDIKSLKMVHFFHVAFARPDILKYLAIPCGYRFIMKEGNIEIRKDDEDENKKLSNYVTNIVGINKVIDRYYDEDKKNFIDIFTCDDPLYPRIKICGTIGVSDYPNKIEMNDNSFKDIPVELLIAGYTELSIMANILSTTGFYITNKSWECQPGTVFMRIVEMYCETSEMIHIMFVSPFLWDKLEPLQLETKTVHWLLCIPISDKELEYKMENGASALEDIFQEKDIDIFDINRRSAI